MKKIKKILAAIMTLAMVLGMSMMTFAAQGSATITVNGAENATIKYLQIVDQDTDSSIGWKFCDTTIENAFKTAFGVSTPEDAITKLTELSPLGNGTAQAGDINSSAELGTALDALKDQTISDDSINKNVITVSKSGLYLITAEETGYTYMPMLAYVDDEGSNNLVNAIVTAKKSENDVKKELGNGEDTSVSPGDIVEYSVEVEYPYYPANASAKTFWVEDNLTNGSFVGSSLDITIKHNGGDYKPVVNTDYTVSPYAESAQLKIDFKYNPEYAGDQVIITYSAEVGEGTDYVKNDIKSNFDSDGDYVQSDMVGFTVLKTDESNEPLPGATFTLYEISTTSQNGFTKVENAKVQTGQDSILENQTFYVKAVGDGDTTGDTASFTFEGLDAQKTYYVKETVAPAGYTVNEVYYQLSGADETTVEGSKTYTFDDFDPITVGDTLLSDLPSTGGIGTTIFTIGGCIIMIAAAGLFFASRRKSSK